MISGEVTRFYYDWLGFIEVDFEVRIKFVISKNDSPVFEHTSYSHQKVPKTMAQDPEAIRAALLSCIDEFFMQARKNAVL